MHVELQRHVAWHACILCSAGLLTGRAVTAVHVQLHQLQNRGLKQAQWLQQHFCQGGGWSAVTSMLTSHNTNHLNSYMDSASTATGGPSRRGCGAGHIQPLESPQGRWMDGDQVHSCHSVAAHGSVLQPHTPLLCECHTSPSTRPVNATVESRTN